MNLITNLAFIVGIHLMLHIFRRSSDAEDLEFNIRELVESTEMKTDKKLSMKAGRRSDAGFGVGDTVTVMVSKKTDAENEVSILSV